MMTNFIVLVFLMMTILSHCGVISEVTTFHASFIIRVETAFLVYKLVYIPSLSLCFDITLSELELTGKMIAFCYQIFVQVLETHSETLLGSQHLVNHMVEVSDASLMGFLRDFLSLQKICNSSLIEGCIFFIIFYKSDDLSS